MDGQLQFAIGERIDTGQRGDERRHGLDEAGLQKLVGERLAKAADRHAAQRCENQAQAFSSFRTSR